MHIIVLHCDKLFDVKINAEPTKLLNLYFHLNPQDLIRTSIDNKMLKQA